MKILKQLPPWLWKTAIFAAGFAFTSQFFIVWCDLIYDCGCTFDMLGGAAHCNIQQAGAPDCPWCADSTYGGAAFGATLGGQALAAFWPGPTAALKRFGATLLASPVFSGLAGLVIGWLSGYWTA